MIRVAINGYGRIGRVAHRVILEKYKSEIDVVAINAGSSTDLTGWMYLLKYDTVYGLLRDEVSIEPSKEELLQKITLKKEFSQLPAKDVELAFAKFDKDNHNEWRKIKLTRNFLRKLYSSFSSVELIIIVVLLSIINLEPHSLHFLSLFP